MALRPGDAAPEFEAVDQEGRTWTRQDLLGRPVVLYFYPKDETPGCVAEACGFRDAWSDYRALGVDVVGVSRDPQESHRAFSQRRRLPFTLLTDEDGRMHEAYGARLWGVLPLRVTYLLDPDGRVVSSHSARFDGASHPRAMLEAARALVTRRTSG